jgi:mannose-1-phosphate guanylyltransferase
MASAVEMKNDPLNRYSVILAGGLGQRLWPLSRGSKPKQLIPVVEGKSLLEAAFERVEGVVPLEQRWVCAGSMYEEAIRVKLPWLAHFIGEPEGRDTLAAVALSCAHVYEVNHEAIVVFLTSDHVIRPVEVFKEALSEAFALVESQPDVLVTFGVKPSFASTGYGYLELGERLGRAALRVKCFKEKPDRQTAENYLAQGPEMYLWNSGMFVWRASRLLELLARYEPATAKSIASIQATIGTDEYPSTLAEVYPTIARKSVDYGIMEPASRAPEVQIACVPLDLEWIDVGSWNAYGTLGVPDGCSNTTMLAREGTGDASAIFLDSRNTLAVSTDPSHLIACFGCEDMVIVHTEDVTLVCPKSKVEEIKALYAKAAEKGWG